MRNVFALCFKPRSDYKPRKILRIFGDEDDAKDLLKLFEGLIDGELVIEPVGFVPPSIQYMLDNMAKEFTEAIAENKCERSEEESQRPDPGFDEVADDDPNASLVVNGA